MAATTASTVYASAALTHIGSGASLATLTISGSADVSTALSSTNLLRYPEADVQLFFNHTATMNPASTSIALYRRDINVDGTGDEPIPNTPNILQGIVMGNVEKGFAEADFITEGACGYETSPNPLPPEPPGAIATWETPEQLTVYTPSQSIPLNRFIGIPFIGTSVKVVPAAIPPTVIGVGAALVYVWLPPPPEP